MTAGRDLDALIAEKVMGWAWLRMPGTGREASLVRPERIVEMLPEWVAVNRVDGHSGEIPGNLPHYSTDIAAAWQVLEKLKSLSSINGTPCDLCVKVGHGEGYFAEIFDLSPMGYVGFDGPLISANEDGESPAHAICLTALKAIGATVPE